MSFELSILLVCLLFLALLGNVLYLYWHVKNTNQRLKRLEEKFALLLFLIETEYEEDCTRVESDRQSTASDKHF